MTYFLCVFQADLPSIEECNNRADDLESEDNLIKRIEYCVLSSHQEKALDIGLTQLKCKYLGLTQVQCKCIDRG